MCRRTLLLALVVGAMVVFLSLSAACGDDDDDDNDTGDDDASDDDDAGDDDFGDDDDSGDDDFADDDDDTGDDDSEGSILGCIEGDFSPYQGVFHAHTSYSDGEQTPADAFEHGRDVAMLDILVITDHLEQLYFEWPNPDLWGSCHEQADAANDPGNFLAMCGFEYGSGFRLPLFQSTGHNNVFYSDELFPMIQLDFHDFYQTLVECPRCIGQFNHPGDDEWQHWNHFEYFADVDDKMNLFEFNGGGPVWDLFVEALDAGWHVSPMYNQDNHDPDWGSKDDRRSGLFLAGLQREDVREAMRARRSFMTYDKNAVIRIMADETCWMGSVLSGYATVTLDLEAYDLDEGDGFATLDLYGPEMELLESVDCAGATLCQGSFEYAVDAPAYFFARADQQDGGWLVSAPIWVEP